MLKTGAEGKEYIENPKDCQTRHLGVWFRQCSGGVVTEINVSLERKQSVCPKEFEECVETQQSDDTGFIPGDTRRRSVHVAVPGEEVVENAKRRLQIAVHDVYKREEGGA